MGEHTAENPVSKEAGTKDDVRCHFGDALMPHVIRLHQVKEEVLSF
jgi:hypothetical protein